MRSNRLLIAAVALLPLAAEAAVLTVGPQGRFSKPCQAFAAATDGDVVEIDAAGTYSGDVCAFAKNNLLIRGVNGRPKIDAAGRNSQGKAIWVVGGNDNIVENVEMSGAQVPDKNGAAIRFEGVNITLRRVYFHDNEDGMLTMGRGGDILIEYSEFDRNGEGNGYSHNLYVNYENRLTVRFSYFHRSHVGNVIKSRAAENYFYYNRFMGEDGDGSWEVDLSNGGYCVLVGNVIQQGPRSTNSNIMNYMAEGPRSGNKNVLLMAYNTLVNEGAAIDGDTPSAFIFAGNGSFQGLIVNNLFAGPGVSLNPAAAANVSFHDNLAIGDPSFATPQKGDYRLKAGSPAAGKAVALPRDMAALLTPLWQIQEPVCGQRRAQRTPASVGAFEVGPSVANESVPCAVTLEGMKARVSLASASLTANAKQVARVSLDGVAPAGGALVRLYYLQPALLQGPASVTIPEGESSATVELNCTAPKIEAQAAVTAVYHALAVTTTLAFPIPDTSAPILAGLSLSPVELDSGISSKDNYITLKSPAPAGGTLVALRSSDPLRVEVPGSVRVPEGSLQAAFNIQTRRVQSDTPVMVTASQGGAKAMAQLKLKARTRDDSQDETIWR